MPTLTVERKLLSSESRLSQPPWCKYPLAIAPFGSEIDDLENERHKAIRASKASFVLASMLGNTGFIGLAIDPTLVGPTYCSLWLILFK
ncbi:hypothetical protein [Myxosarcina sp. GI1(2024)]